MSAPRGGSDLPSLKEFRRQLQEIDERPRPATLEEAKERLAEAMADARASMARARVEVLLTQQEKDQLTLAAQRGELGEGMRRLGDEIARGQTTWDEIWDGTGEDSEVFAGFLREQAEEKMPELRRRIEEADLLR